jgi:protein TonB
MSAWVERSYKQALGVSLGIHGLLLGMFLLLGQPAAVGRAQEAKPLAVEIVPSRVLEMGKMDGIAGVEAGEPAASSLTQAPQRGAVRKPVFAVGDGRKLTRAAVAAAPASVLAKAAAALDTSQTAPPEILPEASAALSLKSRVTTVEAENEPDEPGEAKAEESAQDDNADRGTFGIHSGLNDCAGAEKVNGNTLAEAGERMTEGGEGKASGLLKGTAPRYPAAARKAGWEGLVVARVVVDTRGYAASVSIHESSGYPLLDQAVIKAVQKWIFTPATQAGKPIVSFHDVKVRFRLADQR